MLICFIHAASKWHSQASESLNSIGFALRSSKYKRHIGASCCGDMLFSLFPETLSSKRLGYLSSGGRSTRLQLANDSDSKVSLGGTRAKQPPSVSLLLFTNNFRSFGSRRTPAGTVSSALCDRWMTSRFCRTSNVPFSTYEIMLWSMYRYLRYV